jgi:mono/diheme cytochrome c family protein
MMARHRLWLVARPWICLVLSLGPQVQGLGARADGPSAAIDFDRQVRPILSNNCFQCHGPDANERQAELRLDLRDEALQPADSGVPAIVPGKPDESPLVRRIFSRKKGFQMPPPESNKTLSEADKHVLRAWIEQGARYQTHWSFVRPRRPAPPSVQQTAWPSNAIDRFLLARLETEGLHPSPEADRATLIRRVTFDLTGLPPTPAEVEAFVNDPSSEAYEKVVDRLLASPRYGERMALDWLDAARFADTHGYHIDSGRDMTRWRDWVIHAFNTNKPFNEFTVEQLAGDLLPDATIEQKIASGFNRNHMINFEGGAIPEEYLTAYIVDRVNTTGTVWLGLTIGCTQCHDHKFDPLTQKDFYRFYAFFNSVPENGLDGRKGNAEPMLKLPTPEQRRALDRLAAEIAPTERALASPIPEDDAAQARWETRMTAPSGPPAWTVLEPRFVESSGGATLKPLDDGTVVAEGANPDAETYRVVLPANLDEVTAIRLEVFPDDRLNGGGPGRSSNGNIVLTEARLEVVDRPVPFRAASADFSQDDFPVASAIDGRPDTGWAIYPEVGKPHAAVFAVETPIQPEGEDVLVVTLEFRSGWPQHQPSRFRLSATNTPNPLGRDAVPANVARLLALAPEKRTDAQLAALRTYFREKVSPETKPQYARLAGLKAEQTRIDQAIPSTMVMQELPRPRETFMLERGQYDKKGEKVTPGVPASLPPLPEGTRPDRLALARWLVDPGHPLVGRVIANRIWQLFFGTGLVKTAEDFGSQGDLPSHPELLDWLASEFVTPEDGTARPWDVKRLVRLIVTSSAYRQSSAVTHELFARDPENRLLARGPRHRLQAEFIRDQALAISGLLDGRIGGSSVSPYQPPGLWEELASRLDGKNWTAQTYTQDHGADLYRRTMYTFWKRTSPPPTLVTFDAPDRETCTVRRARTNTPLQALVLLNDPTYVEAARKLAERILTEAGPDPADRIALAFRLATARRPRAAERAVLQNLHDQQLATYRNDPKAALKLLSVGESQRNQALDPAELAAWSMVASTILNLDETVNKN